MPGKLLQCKAPLVADYIERLGGLHTRARVTDRILQHGIVGPAAAAAAATSTTRSTSSSNSSSSNGSGIVAGLQPQDPQHPKEGQLLVRLLQLQPQSPTSSPPPPTATASDAAAGVASIAKAAQQQPVVEPGAAATVRVKSLGADAHAGAQGGMPSGGVDGVPSTVLPLLHHMFLEQMPVIVTTLKLLKAWIVKQQQQQQQQAGNDTRTTIPTSSSSSSSSSSSRSGSSRTTSTMSSSSSGGRWLVVPHFLGSHAFTLYNPLTGQALQPPSGVPLTRIASSYTAWRAAEIVEWYLQLDEGGKGDLQQLLAAATAAGNSTTAVTTAGSGSSSSSSSSGAAAVTAAGSDGCNGGSNGDSHPQQGAEASGSNATAAAAAGCATVDAVQAFAEVVRLVGECGRIERRANRVVVWCPEVAGPASKL